MVARPEAGSRLPVVAPSRVLKSHLCFDFALRATLSTNGEARKINHSRTRSSAMKRRSGRMPHPSLDGGVNRSLQLAAPGILPAMPPDFRDVDPNDLRVAALSAYRC